jgi:hypothetical protein
MKYDWEIAMHKRIPGALLELKNTIICTKQRCIIQTVHYSGYSEAPLI